MDDPVEVRYKQISQTDPWISKTDNERTAREARMSASWHKKLKKATCIIWKGSKLSKKNFEIFFSKNEKKNFSKILTTSIWYRWLFSIFYVNWGHLWEIMFNKLHQKVPWQKSFFSGENSYFFNFGVKFFKRVRPYGSENIFPQLFNLKGLWA